MREPERTARKIRNTPGLFCKKLQSLLLQHPQKVEDVQFDAAIFAEFSLYSLFLHAAIVEGLEIANEQLKQMLIDLWSKANIV